MLTACASYSLDDLASSAETMEEDVSTLINELNTVFDAESNLQPTFEEDLDANPELDQFADESAGVFDAIQTRRDSLSNIQDLTSEIADHGEYLADYDGEELDSSEVSQLADHFSELAELLESYTNDYTTNLDQENEFFTSLGNSDAGPETLIDGIDSINENHQDLTDQASQINQKLDEVLSQLNSFQSAVSQAQEQEGD